MGKKAYINLFLGHAILHVPNSALDLARMRRHDACSVTLDS